MMNYAIGLDIGGTKIAGALFDAEGRELAQVLLPTPGNYEPFLETCRVIVDKLEQDGRASSLGACAPYADAGMCANLPYLAGKNLRRDLENIFNRPVPLGNDANCAALAEALEGPGKGHEAVFGLIIGTGIGGGFVFNGRLLTGANGMSGEIGHLPLPCYEESDGEYGRCSCGKTGCIEHFISGAGLSRLYRHQTGRQADAKQIGTLTRQEDPEALHVLDRYYTLVAKAMVVVLHSFDPGIITVSGGLNSLPGIYDEVPKRWGQYSFCKSPSTKFVPASFGAMAGLRGAAWLGKRNE